jgi:hypothetical protein
MLTREGHHLSDLGLGNLVGEHATHALTFGMHFEHDPSCSRAVHGEDALEHIYDELHRREIVVQEDDLIERRLFEARCVLINHKFSLMSCALFTHDLQRVNNCKSL